MYTFYYIFIVICIMLPSVVAHMVHAFITVFAVLIFIAYFPKLLSLDVYRVLVLVLLFAIVIGVHGISHLFLEKTYGYNPWSWYCGSTQKQAMGMRRGGMNMDMSKCPCHQAVLRTIAVNNPHS